MKIVISSGHGKYVRGASGILDEVDEARRVVEEVAKQLHAAGVQVVTFHDNVSKTQNENLNRIVDFHNAQGARDFDVSVHFNAYAETDEPMGTECLYTTQAALADLISENIANAAGLIDRGPKKRTDLFFLNQTEAPAVLIETCFVDSTADAAIYDEDFTAICCAITTALVGTTVRTVEPPSTSLLKVKGKCSYFGGPDDMGVDADEGLAFIYEYEQAPWLFLEQQPPGTTGLARRLNVDRPYVACRWDYAVTPKTQLAQPYPALVRAPATGKQFLAWPADWGPHEDTKRVADLSPSLMDRLGITTDDEVEVIYPAPIKKGLFDRLATEEKKSQ
jgi:N-acetylmuramoyl-L-alanine amidase